MAEASNFPNVEQFMEQVGDNNNKDFTTVFEKEEEKPILWRDVE